MTSKGPISGDPLHPDSNRVVDICIPIFHDDPSALVRQLAAQSGAETTVLHIYDDGSCDADLTSRLVDALQDYPGTTNLISMTVNLGRSAARNALIRAARGDWLLFLDGDMRIDGTGFLQAYLQTAATHPGPCCIVGGFGLDLEQVTAVTRLHALQAIGSDCLSAPVRSRDPGRYVFASNIFLHRLIIETVHFNPDYRGWGWEDVDWGLNVVRRFPVLHIDNPAIHLGLDSDQTLLRKYQESGPNFMLLLRDHPDCVSRMPLYRYARLARHLPCLPALAWALRQSVIKGRDALPQRARLLALKLFRVTVYARAMAAQSGQPAPTGSTALAPHDG